MTPPMATDASVLAMEAPPDGDDIFGPSRSFPPRPSRPRPSMISAKLRAKEERKKVIQICTEKLEKLIFDRNLRRSVCINNTYSKLQDEVRREKQLKHMSNATAKCEDVRIRGAARQRTPNAEQKQRMLDKALESIDNELSAIDASMPSLDHEMLPDDMGIVSPLRNHQEDVLGSLVSSQVVPPLLSAELSLDIAFGGRADSYSTASSKSVSAYDYKSDSNARCRSRKRSFDEVADCDVHEVLSQFYPTPRLISNIDDDVLLNVEDDEPIELKKPLVMPPRPDTPAKKIKLDDNFEKMLGLTDTDLNQNKSDFQTLNDLVEEPTRTIDFNDTIMKRAKKSEFEIILDALRLDDGKEVCEREDLMYFCSKSDKLNDGGEMRSRFLSGVAVSDSCGQAAILGDQQSAGFHGLLASLET